MGVFAQRLKKVQFNFEPKGLVEKPWFNTFFNLMWLVYAGGFLSVTGWKKVVFLFHSNSGIRRIYTSINRDKKRGFLPSNFKDVVYFPKKSIEILVWHFSRGWAKTPNSSKLMPRYGFCDTRLVAIRGVHGSARPLRLVLFFNNRSGNLLVCGHVASF